MGLSGHNPFVSEGASLDIVQFSSISASLSFCFPLHDLPQLLIHLIFFSLIATMYYTLSGSIYVTLNKSNIVPALTKFILLVEDMGVSNHNIIGSTFDLQ